jgi:hypothetical protein
MTEQTHPMIPPTELLGQWEDDWFNEREHADVLLVNAYAAGALAGADQELEACCEWLQDLELNVDTCKLRAARRPNPLSLKEQAMQALCRFMASEGHEDCTEEEIADDFTTIRRALEQLPDHE